MNRSLVLFIKDAKKRGFNEEEIKKALINKGWKESEINDALVHALPSSSNKNQITIFLNNEILRLITKRAKRNMLSVSEQIEDIVRRSTVNAKGISNMPEKIDDLLVSIFSRKAKKNHKVRLSS